ncbi:bZIP transcription factor [Natronomonas gomsonensis]|jgi:uncharacterized coiled-coil protein SlyX|uniref:DUF7518 family protein n=1 Tax=Natronomonas gomsonensis TaxID=1046043 RepID=UPI0020CA9B2E|nr:bZIP transcription factor [Natronomonas gomsonensis]MCY4730661.1 bZIP transcription factor [Natronomonas gomsonensis]
MSGNRVEELEAKVRDLEATIDGLTDELVETKERLHAVESEVNIENDVLEGRMTRAEAQEQTPEQETEESADDGEASADEVTSEEAEEEDNADSESGDDIIVA